MWQDCWDRLTDPILLKIFYYLSPKDILSASATCSNWSRISYDELLWKYQFCKNYNLSYHTELKPGMIRFSITFTSAKVFFIVVIILTGQTSWYEEYKRLTYHAPLVETEVLKSHTEPVLYVTFSHNGEYFVTCSMDGFVLVSIWAVLTLYSLLHQLHGFITPVVLCRYGILRILAVLSIPMTWKYLVGNTRSMLNSTNRIVCY